MKRIMFTFLACAVAVAAGGQEVAGDWNGILKVQGQQLRLVFHISRTENGYSATMDSPDQGAKSIPVTSVSFENPVLKLAVANLGVEYEGLLGDDGNITGTFKQTSLSFPLNLSKEKVEKEKAVRPQEPVKPYPYYEEEVFFRNAEADVMLAGTLTLPKKDGVFPTVVLVSGSGAHDRNEEIMEHKPFLVLADYLTRNGMGVLRFDDRGTASSTGNFQTATSFDHSKDVEAAVKYLLTRKEVNKRKIGLIGHSEGGIIASMVAARSENITYLILLAGVGIPGGELLLLQQKLIADASGFSESDWKKGSDINRGLFEIVKKSTDTEERLKTELTAYLEQVIKKIPDTHRQTYDERFIRGMVDGMASAWMQYFIKYDPAPVLEKVKCPVLALNGAKDLQVSAKVNLETIKAALTEGGNKNVTVKEIPGLNHLFQECTTGLPAEYGIIEQTFSPVALKEIIGWLRKTVITN
jgi:pimeloyl-ACP methyl ester carboxylesterase